ncbi:MAG TPA: sulfatase-like hydrolase/transferase [Pirellulaceae bacterium]|jgi:arylsulfatase A-like enzyme|nr:sulfatase-like hydrolase/transferase [Pirellulaceae bacterium]
MYDPLRFGLAVGALALFAVLSSSAADADQAKGRRPNVVIFLADDMRPDSIAALGNVDVKTPHLDALARRSLVFRRAYCMGGNSGAVCRPSRNMLLSGDAFFRFGASPDASPEPPNLPWSFGEAGYVTYSHSKKGNVAKGIQAQFDVDRYLKNDEVARTDGEPTKETVDDALAFLQERANAEDDKPFLMFLAPANPHDPRVADERWYEGYDADQFTLPPNVMPQHPFDNGEMLVRDERLLPWPRTEADVRQTLLDYYAVVTAMDHQIGRLTQALEEHGFADDTIFVFTADQGIALGSHGLLGKQNLYEHSMGVPLLIAGPGVKSGDSQALVYLIDVYPTLCELAGLSAPEGIDGRSFANVVSAPESDARDELVLGYRDVQRALVTDRWKLIRYPQVDVTQLFDLKSDSHELRDLSQSPEHRETARRLLSRLETAKSALGDEARLSVKPYRPAAWSPPAE